MRSLGNKTPPVIGYVLREPLRCPECDDILIPDDTGVCIISDVICEKCQLIVIEVER